MHIGFVTNRVSMTAQDETPLSDCMFFTSHLFGSPTHRKRMSGQTHVVVKNKSLTTHGCRFSKTEGNCLRQNFPAVTVAGGRAPVHKNANIRIYIHIYEPILIIYVYVVIYLYTTYIHPVAIRGANYIDCLLVVVGPYGVAIQSNRSISIPIIDNEVWEEQEDCNTQCTRSPHSIAIL